jgi:hypothetical protein
VRLVWLLICCRRSKKTGASAPLSESRPPPWSRETRDVDDHEEQEPAASADRSGDFDCGGDPDQLNQLATIGPHLLRQLVTGDRTTPQMSRNGLLLLIAGLAVLVAVGILTS